MCKMPPLPDYYKNVPNRAEIETLLAPYDMEECMEDIEFFPELVSDLKDDHPHIENLHTVLDRMLAAALEAGGFRL